MIKNLLTLCFSLVVLSCYAQKDVKLVLLEPKPGDTLFNLKPMRVKVRVFNLGNEAIPLDDTLKITYYLNNQKVITGPGKFYHAEQPLSQPLNGGDSAEFQLTDLNVYKNPNFAFETFCVDVNVKNEPLDNWWNNKGCVTLFSRWKTGLNEQQTNTAKLYPNPAKDVLFLEGLNEVTQVEVFDGLGKLVHSGISNSTNYSLQVKDWPKGLYLVHIPTSTHKQVIKFWVE